MQLIACEQYRKFFWALDFYCFNLYTIILGTHFYYVKKIKSE